VSGPLFLFLDKEKTPAGQERLLKNALPPPNFQRVSELSLVPLSGERIELKRQKTMISSENPNCWSWCP
jgi:hypothetical protein